MKHITLGMLAHVDAGKTTLSESMLYLSGSIRKAGRVDHGDAFFDYDRQERKRGITIYSKQAHLRWKNTQLTLADTPGHVDFQAEMERVLPILDYALLVISGLDAVQCHTETIWNLLAYYQIPVFLFINKMDITYLEKEQLLADVQAKLSASCIDMSLPEKDLQEAMAVCDEELLEHYLQNGKLTKKQVQEAICQRKLFPCFFGSALKQDGVSGLLDAFDTYMASKRYPSDFGAKVYKITHDEQGNRLTHVKITGGSLKVKTKLENQEKVDQIRVYFGNKYEMREEVFAGELCALKGLKQPVAGDGLGIEQQGKTARLTSYLRYRVRCEEGYDAHMMQKHLYALAEEDPQLHVSYDHQHKELYVQLMGDIQTEVLKQRIKELYHTEVFFDEGSVLYKETIRNPVEGVGHYEPLRHYAEVHLLLEPLPSGSGLQIFNACSEDELSASWQKQIISFLKEGEHVGVLSGSPITDMKITLLAGKAHQKHTEGGDFREACGRALRQGLKCAEGILLEPYVSFRIDLPKEHVSRAMFDMEQRKAVFSIVTTEGERVQLQGSAPVAKMRNYQQELLSYTKGKGKLICTLKDYEAVEKQEEVLQKIGYDSDADIEHPADSIFCAHGAGFLVRWDKVKEHMHVHTAWSRMEKKRRQENGMEEKGTRQRNASQEELEQIFQRTYGRKEERKRFSRREEYEKASRKATVYQALPECMLVDGYNVIHAWPSWKELAEQHMDAAREQLIHAMCSYQGYRGCELILVFDAYKTEERTEKVSKHGNIYVVYTRKAQTADAYIEQTTHKLAAQYRISVVTSDGLEQLIASAQGAQRISSRQLYEEYEALKKQGMAEVLQTQKRHRTYLLEDLRKYKETEEE